MHRARDPRGKEEASGLTLSLATGLCQLSQGRLSTLLPGVLPLLDPLRGVPNPCPSFWRSTGFGERRPPTFFLSLISGQRGVLKSWGGQTANRHVAEFLAPRQRKTPRRQCGFRSTDVVAADSTEVTNRAVLASCCFIRNKLQATKQSSNELLPDT